MQSTKCYHGPTIMFNLKTLRLTLDFGYAESFAALCQIHLSTFTEEISERMALDPPDYFSVSIYSVNPHHFCRNIEATSIT